MSSGTSFFWYRIIAAAALYSLLIGVLVSLRFQYSCGMASGSLVLIYIIGAVVYTNQHSPGALTRWRTILYVFFIPGVFFVRTLVKPGVAHICISVDMDMHLPVRRQRKAILLALDELSRCLRPDQVTLFIHIHACDPNDFTAVFKRIQKEGWDVQLHSHFVETYWRKHNKPPSRATIRKQLRKEKRTLEKVFSKEVRGFRAGSHVLADDYSVLVESGFSWDSSVLPGFRRQDSKRFDYIGCPRVGPYSPVSGLVEIPCSLFLPSRTYLETLQYRLIAVSYLFHPSELEQHGKPNWRRIALLRVQFFLLRLFLPRAKYCTVDAVAVAHANSVLAKETNS